MKKKVGKAYWTAILERYEKHDGSIRSFCKQQDISEASFYQWRKKLGKEPAGGFVELRPAATDEVQGVVVSLMGSGVKIELPPHWDAEQLATLINALQIC